MSRSQRHNHEVAQRLRQLTREHVLSPSLSTDLFKLADQLETPETNREFRGYIINQLQGIIVTLRSHLSAIHKERWELQQKYYALLVQTNKESAKVNRKVEDDLNEAAQEAAAKRFFEQGEKTAGQPVVDLGGGGRYG